MLKCLALGLLVAAMARGQCLYEDDASKKAEPEARVALYRGQLRFTLRLFAAVQSAAPDDNVFFSPFSVYHSLLLAYFSAGGHTEERLKEALQIADGLDKVNLMSAYKADRRARLAGENRASYEFSSANRLFVDEAVRVRQCMRDLFGDELHTLRIAAEPGAARERVNAWAARATRDHIRDLLPPDALDEATRLVLANAAYFKGVWAARFPPERTRKEAFFVSESRQTLVPFMKQKGTFHYTVSDELGAQILELPYKGNDISMYILLPPYSMKEGVANIIARLTPERLAAVVEESYMGREVLVELPRFTVERSLSLAPILKAMGAGELFNSTVDLSTLAEDDDIRFGDARHKAKIQLDEEGTVAAAATAVFGFRSSRPAEPTRFVANFPFVYLLYERPTNSVLFMGVYRDPKK